MAYTSCWKANLGGSEKKVNMGGWGHSMTHGPVAGVNALSIQAKTNPNQVKQNNQKKKK